VVAVAARDGAVEGEGLGERLGRAVVLREDVPEGAAVGAGRRSPGRIVDALDRLIMHLKLEGRLG